MCRKIHRIVMLFKKRVHLKYSLVQRVVNAMILEVDANLLYYCTFFIDCTAESNRVSFEIAEAESDVKFACDFSGRDG